MKTELITNVSHDLKTPLTSIISYIDLLKRENFTDPKVLEYLDILEAKAARPESTDRGCSRSFQSKHRKPNSEHDQPGFRRNASSGDRRI